MRVYYQTGNDDRKCQVYIQLISVFIKLVCFCSFHFCHCMYSHVMYCIFHIKAHCVYPQSSFIGQRKLWSGQKERNEKRKFKKKKKKKEARPCHLPCYVPSLDLHLLEKQIALENDMSFIWAVLGGSFN